MKVVMLVFCVIAILLCGAGLIDLVQTIPAEPRALTDWMVILGLGLGYVTIICVAMWGIWREFQKPSR